MTTAANNPKHRGTAVLTAVALSVLGGVAAHALANSGGGGSFMNFAPLLALALAVALACWLTAYLWLDAAFARARARAVRPFASSRDSWLLTAKAAAWALPLGAIPTGLVYVLTVALNSDELTLAALLVVVVAGVGGGVASWRARGALTASSHS